MKEPTEDRRSVDKDKEMGKNHINNYLQKHILKFFFRFWGK